MKKQWLMILCTVLFISCTAEQATSSANLYTIDQAATAKAPWKPGDIVSKAVTSASDDPQDDSLLDLHRKFLGITVNGHYLVQEFYAESGQKYSDPFLITKQDAISSGTSNKGKLGRITYYYLSGKKRAEGIANHDWWADGTATIWYESGQKASESLHQNRRMIRYTNWYPNGQMKADVHYEESKPPQITEWDEQGNITRKP